MARRPAYDQYYDANKVPFPVRNVENPEVVGVFRAEIRGLFEQYEEWQPEFFGRTALHWRDKVLDWEIPSGGYFTAESSIQDMCACATNTGVPPDEILAVYSLLFL